VAIRDYEQGARHQLFCPEERRNCLIAKKVRSTCAARRGLSLGRDATTSSESTVEIINKAGFIEVKSEKNHRDSIVELGMCWRRAGKWAGVKF